MTQYSPFVSVVIPVYNSEAYLDACIQSVLRQSYKNLEVIIVNDGSTDNSLAIISRYMGLDKRIVLVDKPNEGLPLARKSGVDIAHGQYIQHLDSDDVLVSDAVEHLVSKAESTNADIVAAPFLFVFEDGYSKPSQPLKFTELTGIEYFREVLNGRAHWNVWANFQRRSLFLENQIETIRDISFGEDAILMTQLILYAKKVCCVDKPIIHYNRYPASMSHSENVNDKKYEEFRVFTFWIEKYVEKKGVFEILEKDLAALQLWITFESIYWKRFADTSKDMKKVIRSLKKFPELRDALSKRKQKIIFVYKMSPFWGYLNLMRYSKQGRI